MKAEPLLAAPWAGAALRFLADPEPAPEPEALPAAIAWAAPALTASPPLRMRAVEALCGLPEREDPFAAPGARLLLLPDPARLLRHVAAWLDAEALARLLLRTDIAAARDEIGAEALDFARRQCLLLPRPNPTLALVLGERPRLERAALLFGYAAAPLEPALAARLALRAPAALFAEAAAVACEPRPETPQALAALRRLVRELEPQWHAWLH